MTTELVRAVDQRRCALYRHFDESDVLLYIGITDTLADRTNNGHARTSDWVQFAARAEAEWHDSRDRASAAEREAVKDERPVFNRQYAEWDVDRSILEYLHQRAVVRLQAKADEYEQIVRRFLSLASETDVQHAEAKATTDYRNMGREIDDLFPASVLRYLANSIERSHTDARDCATADALHAVIEFAGKQLEAIRDRRQAWTGPPF